MSDGGLVRGTARHVSAQGITDKRLPVGRPGTVLFAMYASVGVVAELAVTASWNQALLGIEPVPGVSNRRFVRYWMEHLRPGLGALARSNTQDNLNAEQVGNLDFPVLPVETQRAIADYLDTETSHIDTLITKKRRMIELFRQRWRSMVEYRMRSLMNTHGTIALKRVVVCLDGRRVPLSAEERSARRGPYPYYGASGVIDSVDSYLFDETIVLLGEDGCSTRGSRLRRLIRCPGQSMGK